MAKQKTLIIIIIVLLLANLAQLFFHFGDKKHGDGKNKNGFVNELKKNVGFTDAQVQQLDTLKQTHWANAKKNMAAIQNLKQQLLIAARNGTGNNDSAATVLADSIGRLQTATEIYLYNHLREMRKICTPEQQPRFDSMMARMVKQHPGH